MPVASETFATSNPRRRRGRATAHVRSPEAGRRDRRAVPRGGIDRGLRPKRRVAVMTSTLTLNKITAQRGISVADAAKKIADLGWNPSYVQEAMTFPTDYK